MQNDNGWIRLHRKIENNDLWFKEKFTMAQAWVDLLLLANHQKGEFVVRGNWITVDRGQVGYAKETLAKRWKWSRHKVIRFLEILTKTGNIAQQKNNILSLITIKNYNQYQQNGTTDCTTEGQQKDNRLHTNKNVKNDKNEKNKAANAAEPFSLIEKLEKMKTSTDKRMPIIAHYWTYRGMQFENNEQYSAAVRRELRPSADLLGYDLEKIKQTMFFLNGIEWIDWTLETVHKYIDKDLNQLQQVYEKRKGAN